MNEEAVSLGTLKQTIQNFPMCEKCDIFIKTQELSNHALICETARTCNACPKDKWKEEILACVEKLQKQLEIEFDNEDKIVKTVCHNYLKEVLSEEKLQNVVIFHLHNLRKRVLGEEKL